MYLVDGATAAGDTVGLLRADECFPFPPGPDGEPLTLSSPMAARDGSVLVRHKAQELRACNLATGHSQIIPPAGPDEIIGGHHVLLVGDGGVGHQARPFQVVKARLVLEPKQRRRRLQVQTSRRSSARGAPAPKSGRLKSMEKLIKSMTHHDQETTTIHCEPGPWSSTAPCTGCASPTKRASSSSFASGRRRRRRRG